MALVLYGILVHMGTFTLRAGVISGAFCWFGFVLPTVTANNAFAAASRCSPSSTAARWLGALVIIGAILGWMGR